MNVLAAVFICAFMLFGDMRQAAAYADMLDYNAFPVLWETAGQVDIGEKDELSYLPESAGLYALDSFKGSGGLVLPAENKEVSGSVFGSKMSSEGVALLALLAEKEEAEAEAEPRIYLDDIGKMFTAEEREAIRNELEEISRDTGWCVGMCTGCKFSRSDAIYSGAFGDDSGVMLYINKNYAKIKAVGEAEEYVNGERAENIVRLTERSLRHKNYRKIPSQLGKRLAFCIKNGKGSFDFYPPALVIALIFGLSSGIGTVFFISRRYSAYEPPIVNNYLDVRSIEMYRREDTLLSAHSVDI